MLCKNPYKRGVQEFGCGQCIPCRVNKSREWKARLVLEACGHKSSSFITLTYSDDTLPAHNSLSRQDYRSFTKGIGFRYFGVGEYGNKTGRPHYHFVLFGLGATPSAVDFVESRWRKGRVQVAGFSHQAAGYITGYVTKKLRKADDKRLGPGQIPEFASMSRRPAIGTCGVEYLAARQLEDKVYESLDVDAMIRIDGKPYQLGQTLREKIRAAVALPELKDMRGRRAVDFAIKSMAHPELALNKEIKRETQAQRFEALNRVPKGRL